LWRLDFRSKDRSDDRSPAASSNTGFAYTSRVRSLVSIIIPTYNSGNFLTESVESALNQDYPSIEVIVIDDGSTDSSIKLLDKYKGRITCVTTSNRGAASARNTGILISKGEYIAFLDSDDIWLPNKLSKQMALMDSQKLDLVYCSGQEFDETGKLGLVQSAKYEGDCYELYVRYPTRDILAIGPSGTLIKRSHLAYSGLFDTRVPAPTEDWDFFRRYSLNAKIGFCSEVLVHRRIHANNISKQSLVSYYNGNRSAILKLMVDDKSLNSFDKRNLWIKFQFISLKGFLKKKDFINSFKSLIRLIFPIII
jgi:glycosyltransferase involved in cell wall biosynthesis